MEMTNNEICTDYRQAKDKSKQIKVLAELNLCSREKIVDILTDGGVMSVRSAGQWRRGNGLPKKEPVKTKADVPEEPVKTKADVPEEPVKEKAEVPEETVKEKTEGGQVKADVPEEVVWIVRQWLNANREKYEDALAIKEAYEKTVEWLGAFKEADDEQQ